PAAPAARVPHRTRGPLAVLLGVRRGRPGPPAEDRDRPPEGAPGPAPLAGARDPRAARRGRGAERRRDAGAVGAARRGADLARGAVRVRAGPPVAALEHGAEQPLVRLERPGALRARGDEPGAAAHALPPGARTQPLAARHLPADAARGRPAAADRPRAAVDRRGRGVREPVRLLPGVQADDGRLARGLPAEPVTGRGLTRPRGPRRRGRPPEAWRRAAATRCPRPRVPRPGRRRCAAAPPP